MAAEAGHAPNRAYFAQDGSLHLNGAAVYDANEAVVTPLTGRVVGGEVVLDGSNPTAVATGLTTIVAAHVSLKSSSTPGDDPSWLSYDTSGGTLNIYAWKNTGGTDPTLVASTNNTFTVGWMAFGN
jgi:hypothetical protein